MKLKKILSVVLALSMILSMFTTISFATDTATIAASSATAKVGQTVDIKIDASNNPGLVSAKLNVSYDTTALKLVGVKDGGIWGTKMHKDDLTATPYVLTWDNGASESDFTANGTIATLTFEVLSTAKTADYPIELTAKQIINKALSKVTFDMKAGSVSVDGPSITASTASAKIRSTVDVTIEAKDNPGLVSAKLNVSYDTTALKLVGVKDGGIWGTKMHKDDLTAAPYVLTWDNGASESDFTASGTIATLTFEVLDGAEANQDYEIKLTAKQIINKALSKVEFKMVAGKITALEADPYLKTINVTASETAVDAPVKYNAEGPVAYQEKVVTLTASALDQKGDAFAGVEGLAWEYDKEGVSGITFTDNKNGTATLKIGSEIAVGTTEINVTCTATNLDSTGSVTGTKVTVTKAEETATYLAASINKSAIVRPVDENADDETAEITATLYDQYGGEIAATPEYALDKTSDGKVSVVDGVVTVKAGAEVGDYVVTVTAEGKTAQVPFKVTTLAFDWSGVTLKQGGIKYGEALKTAFATLPTTGTATAGGDTYNGTIALKDADKADINVGEYTAEVVFTVTDEGAYKGVSLTQTYTVTVNKADYDMSKVSLAAEEASYAGEIGIEYSKESKVTKPEDVTVEAVVYKQNGEVVAKPVNVGVYDVIVSFVTSNGNYNNPTDLTTTLTIKKATATDFFTDAVVLDTISAASDILTADALKEKIGLPSAVDVIFNYTKESFDIVSWTNPANFDPKGGDYTFVAVLEENANIDTKDLVVEYTTTLTPVEVIFDPALENVTYSKATVLDEGVISITDIAGFDRVTLTTDGQDNLGVVEVVWDKDIEAIKALAQTVSETNPDVTVDISVADATFADYAWVTVVANKTFTFTITNKLPATTTLVEGVADVTYGTQITAPTFTWIVNDTQEPVSENDGTTTITYVAEDGTVYNNVEDVKKAGNYEAVITFTSDIYSGTTLKSAFEVLKKEVEVTAENINIAAKEATVTGAAYEDVLGIDFDKVEIVITDSTPGAGKATVNNIVLTGDAKDNYTLAATSVQNVAVVIAAPEAPAEGTENDVTITVTKPEGTNTSIIVVDQPALDAIQESEEAAKLDMTEAGTEEVEEVIVPNALVDKLSTTRPVVIKLTDAIVEISKELLAEIKADIGAADMTLAAVETVLEAAQQDKIPDRAENVKAVKFTINEAASTFTTPIKVKIPYEKGVGAIKVKYISDDGSTETNIPATHDGENAVFEVAHFSDYVVYTEPTIVASTGGVSLDRTVKFETNGGSAIKSITVSKNGTIAKPEDPTKEGFTFAGWYTDKALTAEYEFGSRITNSFTLYAKWVEDKSETDEPATPDEGKFVDVIDGDWYYDAVMAAVEAGLMNGVSEVTFAPDANVTRAMFVTVLHRLSGDTMDTKDIAFSDVAADSYYASAVAWAKRNGIVSGVTETEFAPDSNITREQMATMLYRYAKANDVDGDISYTDAESISEYAIAAVKWASANGIMGGNPDGTFAPLAYATRAQLAAVFVRAASLIK